MTGEEDWEVRFFDIDGFDPAEHEQLADLLPSGDAGRLGDEQ